MLIKHIDKIAREKNRDVLFIKYDKEVYPNYDYERYDTRNKLIKWLEENDISYELCAHIASEFYGEAYRGQLYLDVPMDENNPKYKLLNQHLENEDGSMKIKGGVKYICFFFLK